MSATSWKFILITFSAYLFCGTVGTQLLAQQGAITGTVIDQSGAVVSFARVTAINQETSEQHSTITASDGRFTVPVPFGKYTVKVEVRGFKTVENRGVNVAASQETHLQIVLFVGDGGSVLGQIKIKVKNEQNRPAPSVSITIAGANGAAQMSGATDQNGEYMYSDAPPGDYTITAKAAQGQRAEKQLHLKRRQSKEVLLTLR